jgi:hypothetical protein
MKNTQGYLDLTFGPVWDYIPITRHYVENFLTINLSEKQKIGKITISVSELLENAVKYSDNDGIRVLIIKHEEKKLLSVQVFNYSTKAHADEHINRINEMNKRNPMEYYLELMQLSATRTDGKSGLGIARVYFEGEAKISAKYHDDESVLEVMAVFNIH